ncbi:MAG: RecX family transcriptional regulator [Alphaproteobacteria bacterium]|nr:MAG: RecX family transcriptional regulator [Alphaproteobacteria bacterium]
MPSPRRLTRASIVTPERLRASALAYLARYSSSQEGLRRVLSRRVQRAQRLGGEVDAAQASAWIEAIIGDVVRLGYVDDATFARGRIRALRARGRSRSMIEMDLTSVKGLAPDMVRDMLETMEHEEGQDANQAEEMAARALIRRRRLGPFRPPDQRHAYLRRDLATLARAGFPLSLARHVLDLSPEDVEDMGE